MNIGAALDHLTVPAAARSQWRALIAALEERGPAACEDALDADAWWPGPRSDVASVVMVCRVCPVRAECAAYAIAAREREGVWGGLLPAERAG